MAVTKTHPIKRALKAAIDYICNPEKTLLELDNGYTQDFSAATAEYIPDFDLEGL